MTGVFTERRNLNTYRRKMLWRHREKTVNHNPDREVWNRIFLQIPWALSRNETCQHADLRIPASRAVRQYISVVSATQFVILCYGSPSKPTQELSVLFPFFHFKRLNDCCRQYIVSNAETTIMSNICPEGVYSLIVDYLRRYEYSLIRF